MKNFLVFFLLGLALVQLTSARSTEQDEERKEVSLFETEEGLDVQAVADPKRCKGKNCRRKKKGRKNRKNKKVRKNKGKKNKRKGRKNRKNKKGRKKRKNKG